MQSDICISSDIFDLLEILLKLHIFLYFMLYSFVGIKQVVFGGSEFEHWKENMTSEEAGYTVHKI